MLGTIDNVSVVCERPIEAVGIICTQSHCCYWGDIEDYLICCRSKEEREIPVGINRRKHLGVDPPECGSVLSVALSGQGPHLSQAYT